MTTTSTEQSNLNTIHRFSQGKFIQTSHTLDLAIEGRGFFTLGDGDRRVYSRMGEFGLDKEGYITDNFGRFLIGFLTDEMGNISGAQGPLKLNNDSLDPCKTSLVKLNLNLPVSKKPELHMVEKEIFCQYGPSAILSIFFVKKNDRSWDMKFYLDKSAVNTDEDFNLEFDSNGKLVSKSSYNISVNLGHGNGEQDIELDLTKCKARGKNFVINEVFQDGWCTTAFEKRVIDEEGVIMNHYAGGKKLQMGMLIIAHFPCKRKLEKVLDENGLFTYAYADNSESGWALIGIANNRCNIKSGYLEILDDKNYEYKALYGPRALDKTEPKDEESKVELKLLRP